MPHHALHYVPASRIFAVAALAFAIAGCGSGGSSGSDNGDEQAAPTPDQGSETPTSGKIQVADYEPGAMAEASLESIVTESYRILKEIAWSNSQYVDVIDVVGESDLGERLALDTLDASQFLCPQGGEAILSFDNGRPRESEDGFMIFSAGDRFTLSHDSCEEPGAQGPIVQEGSTTTTVVDGRYGAFDDFASLNGTVSITYSGVGLHDKNETLSYMEGDVRRSIANGSDVHIQGTSLKVKTPTWSVLAYALQDYDIQLIEIGNSTFFREWEVRAPTSFGLGLGQAGEIYQASLNGVVLSELDSELSAGSYTLQAENRSLEVTIDSEFLSYQADLDGDGSSDIAASVPRP
ncbi:hypothetical protein MLC59_18070 [Marinobacter bryozoorum]|uniref:hypothetical protein n=1 Tax=Marinobacter bryozoorum TaxID=256324 RepID=UPI00200625A5|nr:hypothetical protein [Marinobacter bryozoorum]MCK7546067.1 hypothetical protein [Marinobacter bryozoorum]